MTVVFCRPSKADCTASTMRTAPPVFKLWTHSLACPTPSFVVPDRKDEAGGIGFWHLHHALDVTPRTLACPVAGAQLKCPQPWEAAESQGTFQEPFGRSVASDCARCWPHFGRRPQAPAYRQKQGLLRGSRPWRQRTDWHIQSVFDTPRIYPQRGCVDRKLRDRRPMVNPDAALCRLVTDGYRPTLPAAGR